jgi:Domain of unknown function (DUF4156)
MRTLSAALAIASLVGCAATSVAPGAQVVELVNEPPNPSRCKFLGEVVGSQGNWITGDYTSNKNLVIGARNEMRNEAHKLGGNLVYVQDLKNTNARGSAGTTNTTAVGKAYACT